MSRRHDIQLHLDALRDLRSILGAMRTLALVEIGKLGRFSAAQRQMVVAIERAAADFFAFAPAAGTLAPRVPGGIVAFGSERGFCGGFNETLADALGEHAGPLVIVGRRLATRLPVARTAIVLDGATAAEELVGVVTQLALAMSRFNCAFTLVHHDAETPGLRHVDPLAALTAGRAPLGAYPPRHYEPAPALGAALVEQYLPAVLLDAAYASFLAENRERLRHMEGALEHLDRDLADEGRRLNATRQEDITEEIEVLLLGVRALDS